MEFSRNLGENQNQYNSVHFGIKGTRVSNVWRKMEDIDVPAYGHSKNVMKHSGEEDFISFAVGSPYPP